MTNDRIQRTLRIPKPLVERIKKLVDKMRMSSTDMVMMSRPTASSVMNLALLRGVEMLENQYASPADVDNTRKVERLIEQLQSAQRREERLKKKLKAYRQREQGVLEQGVALIVRTQHSARIVKVTLNNIKADERGLYYRSGQGEADIVTSAGEARELLGLPPRPRKNKR